MFKSFYTTQMSANKNVLQKRFAKIRQGSSKTMRLMSVVMTIAILATTVFATVVMAAVSSDGLEALDKNEVYFIAGMKAHIYVDLDKMPRWVNDISSDGNINFQIDTLNIKHPTSKVSDGGNVDQTLTATIFGDKGNTIISDGLSAANYQYDYSFMIFSDSEKTLLLWSPLDDNLDIISFSICLTSPGSDELAFAHTEKYKENYIDIPTDAIQYIGDLKWLLKQIEYYTMRDYFTFYERNHQNKNVEGIAIDILELDADGLSLKTNISRPEADTMAVCVRKKENIFKHGKYVYKSLAEVGNTELRMDEKELFGGYFTEKMKYSGSKHAIWTGALSKTVNESYLMSGEEYAIDLVLLKTNEDETKRVLYRKRDYVTIQ